MAVSVCFAYSDKGNAQGPFHPKSFPVKHELLTWRLLAAYCLTRHQKPTKVIRWCADSLEDDLISWFPKTTDEPHPSLIFTTRSGRERKPPFLGWKQSENLKNIFRWPSRRSPLIQKTSTHVFGQRSSARISAMH